MIAKAITSTPFSGRTTASPRRTGLTAVFFKIAKPLFLLLLMPGLLLSAARATPVPGATITLNSGQLTNVFSSDDFTVTFTTAQTGLTASNFTVTGTVTGAFVSNVTGSGTSWTVTVTIPGSFQSQGFFTLNLANSTNLSPGLSGLPIAAPTVGVIAYPLDGTFSLSSTNANSGYAKTGDKINFTLASAHYQLEFWGVNVAGQNASGGPNFSFVATGQVTLGSGTAQGPLAWTWHYTNNFNELDNGSGTSAIIFDSVNPTVNISAPSVSSTGTGPVTYNVTYADANFNTSSLSTSNITLNTTGSANGTVTLVENSATNYTVTISNITGAGTLGISIGAGTASDLAGNLAPASNASTTFNVVQPSATTTSISSNNNPSFSASPGNSVSFTATVTSFGSPVTSGTVSFTSNGTAISGGTNVALNGSGQAAVTTSFATAGAYNIVAAYGGNADFSSSSQSLTQQVNLHPTTINSITPVGNSPTNATTLDYTVTFAAALTTPPSTGDFTLTGSATGSINSITTTDNINYDVNVTNVGGDGSLELDMTSGNDVLPGISNLPFSGGAYTIDQTPPTLTSLFYEFDARISGTVAGVGIETSLDFVTNEPIQTATVTIAGHAVTASNVGGNGWEANYIMTSGDTEGRVPFSLTITDLAGNSSNFTDVTQSDDIEFDMTPPTVTISAPSVAQIGNSGSGTATYTVTYADANFNTSNLTNAGVTLNNPTGTATGTIGVTGSGTTYTVTISNITGLGTLGISIGAGYASDLAANIDAGAGPSTTFNVVSSDATLASLSLSSGTLSPTFSPGSTSYTAAVPNSASSITVTATPNDPGATAATTVNGTPASGSAPLSVGPNAINVVVTAADGTTKTYTVTVTRGQSINSYLAAINPSAGHVSPTFTQTNAAYTLSVSNATASITVKPVSTDAGATLKVNGSPLASGTVSDPINLAEGTQTPVTIVVRAANGSTRTYTVTVTRAPSADAKLSSILTGTSTLKPAFVPVTISYTNVVPNVTTSTTITPAAEDANAMITVNGSPATSGSPFTLNNLVVGTNTATIMVTAQDGSTKKTYTVTVTRSPSVNAYLAGLNSSIKPFSPVFAQGTFSYTLAATSTTATMTIAPVTAEPNATMTINTAPATSGATFGPIALAPGPNTINVVVTAQDGASRKTYTITVTRDAPANANNVYQPIGVEKPITTTTLAEDGIAVHQGLSPNGDGLNDVLQIDNISQYPENKLSIMNRNGQLIYEAKGYDNTTKAFDGHSNKNGLMQLPGTYFYQLDYTVNGIIKHKTGFIVLKY